MIIAGKKPLSKPLDNKMLLFNEIMVSAYLYLLLCLTDFMTDHDYRDRIGWLLLYLVVFTVFVNVCKALICFPWNYVFIKISHYCRRAKKYLMEDPVPEKTDEAERYNESAL
jgi:hypothetical protein